MPRDPRKDPYRNCHFLVEIGSLIVGGFTDCSGLGANTELLEYREGGFHTTHKLPGQTKYTNITLKWGLTDSIVLHKWYDNVVTGHIERMDGSIIVLDVDSVTEVARWNFFDAWPTKMEGPTFSAKGNELAIETLEIAHEGIVRAGVRDRT